LIHSFVEEMRTFLRRQIEFSEAANQAFGLITDCSSSVSRIMQNSRILAVNLKIESARLGENGAAVSTIGMEMMNFSNDVRAANTKILNALQDLRNSLPQIRTEMSEMDARTTEFSTQLDSNLSEVEAQTERLDRSLKDSLTRTEQKNKSILDCSLATLSELQFQAPVESELQKAEVEVRSLQQAVSQSGLNSCVELSPADEANVHDGQTSVSGEVVLF
jgi:chromosome segregation ATPase